MLSKKLIHHFESLLSEKVIKTSPLSGGDINEVYLLITRTRRIVVKLNSAVKFPGMFRTEATGLLELQKSNTFRIPEVINFDADKKIAFLLLEYIEPGNPVENFWSGFAEKLALLHKQSKPYFGFENDNYIGSLPQYNTFCNSAIEFYIMQRLQPQFEMASQKGFSFGNLDSFYNNLETEIPNERSNLIHGDLWSGNFMVDIKGFPCLIDPAVAYASREMDIAMMHLFGGFDQELFDVYDDIFPLIENWKERISLWQLYYLLVHLNLFGGSYLPSVQRIIKRYS